MVAVTIAKSEQVLALAGNPWSFLLDDEAARLNSYRHEQAAKDFLAGRVLVRSLLRHLTGHRVCTLRFQIDASRKPALRNESAGHFNLSHSRGWIAAAVADRPVGIDIETAEGADWRLVARRVFPPAEAERLASLSEAEGHLAFCRSWSYKEALIKAVGQDIAHLPEHPPFDAARSWRQAAAPHGSFFMFALTLDFGAGHIAIASPCPESEPSVLSLEAVVGG